ncbi:S8 family peptidase [Succinimonas sp.]|uniref:S8 family peptidase n=1 Tax=Succinimonas sp. TaxID=1936151 RepID=UPI00386BCEBB
MNRRPLLLFPTPDITSRSKNHNGGFGNQHYPSHSRQWERLSPTFTQLQKTFQLRKFEIRKDVSGADPEQVIVMETIGRVEDFIKAVERIDGFEWMGELDVDDLPSDQDFFDIKHPEKELSGRLYMIMTNQRALDVMISLWRKYAAQDNRRMQFDKGLAKFRDVFQHLKDIRRWGVTDRLLDTGIVDKWKERINSDDDPVKFEVELWYRKDDKKRLQCSNTVKDLIKQQNGKVLYESTLKEICYHGLLVELPANAIQNILDNQNVDLVKCDDVMFFRPLGQMLFSREAPEFETSSYTGSSHQHPLPSKKPVIALLDGYPLANHQMLKGRIIIDDPDEYANAYKAIECIHGTSMASLIIYGDLNAQGKILDRPVYIRPIMQPNKTAFKEPRVEEIPDDVLLVDLIHRSVKRLFDGDGTESPVSPTIRVINLSIGDSNRQFLNSMSPLARLIDWLSYTYNVLFVISTGNHAGSIDLKVSQTEFQSLSQLEQEIAVVKAILSDVRNRKLLSPSESINGVTVGSVHKDSSQFLIPYSLINPFQHLLPSPASAFGRGYRKSIKPDIVFPGGVLLYKEDLRSLGSGNLVIKLATDQIIRSQPPGNLSAAPSLNAGQLDGTAYSAGTSNATALVSHEACILYDLLLQILKEHNIDETRGRAYEVPLLKAMLVHGCSWGSANAIIGSLNLSKDYHSLMRMWIGYGFPDTERVMYCTEQRATILGFGQLSNDEAHVYKLPLPPSLESKTIFRRMTVTLAWLSPISANTQRYRNARLWFEVDDKDLVPNRTKGADWHAVRRGTVQHEVFAGEKAVPFNNKTSIEITVNCCKDAGKILKPVAYGLVVTLEVSEELDISVYDEIKTCIAHAIKVYPQMGL